MSLLLDFEVHGTMVRKSHNSKFRVACCVVGLLEKALSVVDHAVKENKDQSHLPGITSLRIILSF